MGQAPPPTERFSDRVADYVRTRPDYPRRVLDLLRTTYGLRPEHVIADLGSGTGILTRHFLDHGNVVHAVEPNQAMAEAAEASFSHEPRFQGRFHSVRGRAEATGLPAHFVDGIVAGQAFHWFDPDAARTESLRILRERALSGDPTPTPRPPAGRL